MNTPKKQAQRNWKDESIYVCNRLVYARALKAALATLKQHLVAEQAKDTGVANILKRVDEMARDLKNDGDLAQQHAIQVVAITGKNNLITFCIRVEGHACSDEQITGRVATPDGQASHVAKSNDTDESFADLFKR